MTNHSESTSPANDAQPNWGWLRERISVVASERLGDWISAELARLEDEFAKFVTTDSRNHDLRGQFKSERHGSL